MRKDLRPEQRDVTYMTSVTKGLYLLSRSLVHANTFDFIPGPVESMQPKTEAFRASAGLTDSMLLLAWAELFSLTKSHSRRRKAQCAELQRGERNCWSKGR